MPAQVTQERYIQALEISRNFLFVKKNIVASTQHPLRYAYYRVMRPLLKLYYNFFKIKNPDTPWTSPASIVIFDRLLTKDMTGFEYGSGNSTKFFASKLGQLVSVEHNQEWYQIVKHQLHVLKLDNVQYQFIAKGDIATHSDHSQEFFQKFNLKPGSFEPKPEFYEYYQFITTFPDQHFDFVLIDGRARVECALNAIPKLKLGGLLVLDNSEREHYQAIHLVLQDWPKVNTTIGLTDTTIWFKP